jgi:heme-degrading monooxygenase HmoA
MSHARIWKFRPPEGREQEFAEAYRGDGAWAQLFRRAPGYRGTSMLRPAEPGGWWLTIDHWDSAADFEAFGQALGEEYRALDEELEGVAGEEEFVGAFEDAD